MHWTCFTRAILLFGVVVLSASLATTAQPKPEETPGSASLAGQLLVAAPEMGDSSFSHAVVLMVRHDTNGALGIIINRPAGEIPVAELLAAIGQSTAGVTGTVRVFSGGPVEPQVGFIVHSAEYHRAETTDIDGRVAVTSSPEVLRDIGHNQGPKQSLVAFGYAGWAPGQLEDELARHAWFTVPEDPKLVFDTDRAKLWDAAVARQTLPL